MFLPSWLAWAAAGASEYSRKPSSQLGRGSFPIPLPLDAFSMLISYHSIPVFIFQMLARMKLHAETNTRAPLSAVISLGLYTFKIMLLVYTEIKLNK